jgi:hypothetical protein
MWCQCLLASWWYPDTYCWFQHGVSKHLKHQFLFFIKVADIFALQAILGSYDITGQLHLRLKTGTALFSIKCRLVIKIDPTCFTFRLLEYSAAKPVLRLENQRGIYVVSFQVQKTTRFEFLVEVLRFYRYDVLTIWRD